MESASERKLNLLEQYGMGQLRRWNRRDAWAVHPLEAGEREALRRLERMTLLRAAITGVVSGSILGGAEVIWAARMGSLGWKMSSEQWQYWGLYLALVVVVCALEILVLYWNGIRSAGRISALAGLQLGQHETGEILARALVRAALELPNLRESVFGVDPYARTPRWKLTLLGVAYKFKVGATSFLLRIVLRRVIGRAALRFFIPLVAIPVYAAWNTVVTLWVLREARARAFGPLAVHDLAQYLSVVRGRLSPDCRRLIVQGVSEAIVRTGTAHPNYHLLLGRLVEVLEVSPQEVKAAWPSSGAAAGTLPETEQTVLLTVLLVAVVIDGRVRKSEAALLEEAHRLCNRAFDRQQLGRALKAFLRGQGIAEGTGSADEASVAS